MAARRAEANHPKTVLPAPPPPPQPLEIAEDFEKTDVGARPKHLAVSGEEQGASIRVTEEQAASGKRSLKITDSKTLEPSWQPHCYYQPHQTQGAIRQSFDVKLTPGAAFFTEWRDDTAYPDCIGPAVTFDAEGRIGAGGNLLATVPTKGWIHVEIEAPLGNHSIHTNVLIGVDDTDTPDEGATWTLVHNIARAVEDEHSVYLSHTIVQLFPVPYRTKNCVGLVAEFATSEPEVLVSRFHSLLEQYTLSDKTGMAAYTGFAPSDELHAYGRKVKRGEVNVGLLASVHDPDLRIVMNGRGIVGAVAALPNHVAGLWCWRKMMRGV